MTDERKLLHEAKTEWKLLVLETRLRAYREEYGEEELNEIMGALKKAGTWAADRVKGVFGMETSKQKKRRQGREKEEADKKAYKEKHGNLKGFGKDNYKGSQGQVKTWGQLKDVLDVANNIHELEDLQGKSNALGAATRTAVGFLLSFIAPAAGGALALVDATASALGNVKNSRDMAMTMRSASDEEIEDSPILDIFKLDDGYQRIVDDGMERSFLSWFGKWIDGEMKGNPDGAVPSIDINGLFEKFLAESGEYDETVTNAETDTKLDEIPYNGKPSEVKQALQKVVRAGEGFVDEFL